MKTIRITAVSYLNTLPFVYGIKHKLNIETYELSLDVPSLCARKISGEQADIGLVPVAIIPRLDDSFRTMDYCIAADGEVDSVLLLSRVPLKEIRKVHLDSDSRTSVLLVRVLASMYWNINPEWVNNTSEYGSQPPESMVVIGDKAFVHKQRYPYSYDLSAEWKAFTGLPFVFAVWMAGIKIDKKLITTFTSALDFGINHLDDAIRERLKEGPVEIDLKKYLSQRVQFRLDERYKKGLKLFLKYASKINCK
jgi:chorismate dehydratase